jgi:hypothetical protein
MNIIGHSTIGLIGYLITNEYLFLIGSIIPDSALIFNELKLKQFDKWDVKYKWMYDLTHSLYAPLIISFISIPLFVGWLIHILIDVPFHSSSFRWKPFLFERYKEKRKVLLLSGGADSIACAEIERNYDCIFFDYGQKYLSSELECAVEYCNKKNLKLQIIKTEWGHDCKNRNYLMITKILQLGYDEVIIGTRNLFPFTDKYKDSNWFNLKMLQYLYGIYINMPLIGKLKYQIIKLTNNYKYYSTEKQCTQ